MSVKYFFGSDLIFNLIKQETLNNLSTFKSYKHSISDDVSYIIPQHNPNKNIYNQDKMKLKTNDSAKYFNCENCGRNISGGRFAQHINKCLQRGKR